MHQQPRATEHPRALNTASRSGQRSGVRGAIVRFIGIAVRIAVTLAGLGISGEVVAVGSSIDRLGCPL